MLKPPFLELAFYVGDVRAFDTSYWSIATADANLAQSVLARLVDQVITAYPVVP